MEEKVFRTMGIRLSQNIVEENGILKCYNVRLARTGPQEYHASSVGKKGDEWWTVYRYPEDVFNKDFLMSLEDKPITINHPPEDVTLQNADQYWNGHIRDIRKGRDETIAELGPEFEDEDGNNTIYGTLIINTKEATFLVKNKIMVEVSLGYDAIYKMISEENKTMKQIPKYGNHCALVEKGRALTAKIRDSDELHNCKYLSKTLPYPYEQGFKRQGVTEWRIVEMTANEYFDALVNEVETHLENEARPISKERVDEFADIMRDSLMDKDNFKMKIPWLLYNSCKGESNDQDGRHRVAALEKLGVTDIPILVMHKTQDAINSTQDTQELIKIQKNGETIHFENMSLEEAFTISDKLDEQ